MTITLSTPLTHDFRDAIGAITMAVECLSSAADDKNKDWLNMIARNAYKAMAIINESEKH